MKKKFILKYLNSLFILAIVLQITGIIISAELVDETTTGKSDIIFNGDILDLIHRIDENTILNYLEELVSFGPRVTATQSCEDAGKYIYNEFKNLGLDVRYHNWSIEYGDLYGSNIEATINGFDETSDEIYIICAHYDSVEGSPGADDDGSGVAAVLAAANVMIQYGFNHTVKFLTFDGEEQGLLGSLYYASESEEINDNIVAVLNADMIGFAQSDDEAEIVRIYENSESEWITDFTIEISELYSDSINLNVERSGYSGGSDHRSFWEYDYDAIFYQEYHFNEFYHSPRDTIDNMDINYAMRITRLMAATLAEFSEINIQNSPNKPETPEGVINGKSGIEYEYSTITNDINGDQIYYLWDWGDNTNSDWIGPYEPNVSITTTHKWENDGEYNIRVKSKDIHNLESEWSDPLIVTMPRGKIYNRFQKINLIIQDYFPFIKTYFSQLTDLT